MKTLAHRSLWFCWVGGAEQLMAARQDVRSSSVPGATVAILPVYPWRSLPEIPTFNLNTGIS